MFKVLGAHLHKPQQHPLRHGRSQGLQFLKGVLRLRVFERLLVAVKLKPKAVLSVVRMDRELPLVTSGLHLFLNNLRPQTSLL